MVVRYLWRQTKIKTNTLENVIKDLIPDSVNKDDLEIIIICKDKKNRINTKNSGQVCHQSLSHSVLLD